MENRGRVDPYETFSFRVAIGAALAAIAGFALVKKLMPAVAAKYRKPKDYVSDVPAASRPIEGVATSVATMPRSIPKPKTKRPSSGSAGRRTPRKKSSGGAKGR